MAPSAATVLATYWTLIAIAFVMISARLYLRLGIHKARQLILSDLLLVAAWCAAVATASLDIVFYKKNVLRPDVNYTLSNFEASPADFEYTLRMIWASVIPFYATLYLCKASLLAVYTQLFPVYMVKRRIALWVTIWYCVAAFIVSISLLLFLCWPVQRNWQITKPDVMCSIDATYLIFHIGWVLHFIGNVLIFTLFFSVVQNLQITKSTRVSVYGILLLGAIDIGFSLTRFLIIQLSNVHGFRAITLIELWSALDANMGLIVTCLPYLHPYVQRNNKPINSYSNSHNTSSNKTTANPLQDDDLFEEKNEGGPSESIGVDRTRESSEVGEITLSPDLPRLEPWNDDGRSDVELVEFDRI